MVDLSALLAKPINEVSDTELIAIKEFAREQARLKPPAPASVSIPCRVLRLREIFQYTGSRTVVEGLLFKNTLTILSGLHGHREKRSWRMDPTSVLDGFPVFGNPEFRCERRGPFWFSTERRLKPSSSSVSWAWVSKRIGPSTPRISPACASIGPRLRDHPGHRRRVSPYNWWSPTTSTVPYCSTKTYACGNGARSWAGSASWRTSQRFC